MIDVVRLLPCSKVVHSVLAIFDSPPSNEVCAPLTPLAPPEKSRISPSQAQAPSIPGLQLNFQLPCALSVTLAIGAKRRIALSKNVELIDSFDELRML
jgi:hypothetical protein